ncbi:salt tolerance down-regulator-domain-containing protein [Lanmaoa asiatica]|nr:salt tolerance down-regulator-domain-containing protein [Lanmaoa asiatica]
MLPARPPTEPPSSTQGDQPMTYEPKIQSVNLPSTSRARWSHYALPENISVNLPSWNQPLSYTLVPPATTTNFATTAVPGNGQQPARTVGTASKAPITHSPPSSSNASVSHKPRSLTSSGSTKDSRNNSKIWSTSTTQEREQIKGFWLGLGENELRNLVKIEKDTVVRKMREQQKNDCSCAVCGRKRLVPPFTHHDG